MRSLTPGLVFTTALLSTSLAFAHSGHAGHYRRTTALPLAPPPTNGTMMPAMQQSMMMMHKQDMMAMMQTTAVWTPQGLVVLQGNDLLHYSSDLQLQHTITLPDPLTIVMAPGAGGTTVDNQAMPAMSMRHSQVPMKILPTDDGLIVVRGQQVIRLDSNFQVIAQTMLPDVLPLTAAEMVAVCPTCQPMMMTGEAVAPVTYSIPMP